MWSLGISKMSPDDRLLKDVGIYTKLKYPSSLINTSHDTSNPSSQSYPEIDFCSSKQSHQPTLMGNFTEPLEYHETNHCSQKDNRYVQEFTNAKTGATGFRMFKSPVNNLP
jgi:hypothetical protein